MSPALLSSAEVEASHEYRSLYDYIQGTTDDLSHARDKFCEPVEEEFVKGQDSEAVEGLLWKAWRAVVGLAAQSAGGSQQQQKLVDFILSIQTRQKLQKGDKVCTVWDTTVWSDLPVFGAQIRASWNFAPSQDTSEDEKTHWLNLNAFVASLVQTAHDRSVSNIDLSLFAIWTLRQGLEDAEQPAEVSIETAAVWFQYAAAAIYTLSRQNKSFDGKLARAGTLFQDKAWTGFSVERWRAWSTRLSELQDQKLGQQCEQSVTEARKIMGEHLER